MHAKKYANPTDLRMHMATSMQYLHVHEAIASLHMVSGLTIKLGSSTDIAKAR